MPTLAVFNSSSKQDGSPGYRERSGWKVEIMEEINDDGFCLMYRVKFLKDSVETIAFENEIEHEPGGAE